MYELIVSKYSNGRAYSEILRKKYAYNQAEDVVTAAKEQVGEGKSVIIRPLFNEVNSEGVYFREWLSVNGHTFTLRFFDVPGLEPNDNDQKYSANQVQDLLNKV